MSEPTPREQALAWKFHTTYELLAPKYGYETRTDTKQFDPASPNGRLMAAVCSEVVNTEVLAVLNEAERELNQMLGEDDSMQAVHTAITQLKQRYGGKE